MTDSESTSDNFESDTDEKPRQPPLKKSKFESNDADEGKTIFIRNLSYSLQEEDLSRWASSYGDIAYAKIVMNKKTMYSLGEGFVKFNNKSDADDLLLKSSRSENDEEFTLCGRRMSLCLAVTRNKAKELIKRNRKPDKSSSRNLHLARIGMIRPGSKEAEGLNKLELAKRDHLMKTKRKKLMDPNVFVSPLRLCVCNLPLNLSDKELLTTFKKAGGPGANITECRIMRDLKKVQEDGKAKSKGFAFVAFDDHEHAMTALLATNNNPSIFGDKNRLIVEFSLENSKALETKKRREMKSKVGKTGAPLSKISPETSVTTKLSTESTSGLPKHFGVKNRRRNRHLKANKAKKPKEKVSRSQKRTLKKKHKGNM